jgi:polyisoprenyl-phosphate glycosyltransferase
MGGSADPGSTLRACVLLPAYNDWACFPRLLSEIDQALTASRCTARVVIVNDGGEPCASDADFLKRKYAAIGEFRMIELVRNLGNQNALSVGMSFIRDELECDVVIVLDSDGQDLPGDIPELLAAYRQEPRALVVAERSGRAEGLLFRVCYRIYRTMFQLMVGKRMSFGNFSVIPWRHLPRLCSMAELPVNFAAALIKSRLQVVRVPIFRGARYDGVSSQNIVALIIHGVNGILVFGEIALVRVTLLSAFVVLFALIGIGVVGAVRLFTNYAIAGWASNVIGILVLLLGQGILFSLLATLVRGRNPISLIVDPQRYKLAIASVTAIKGADLLVAVR